MSRHSVVDGVWHAACYSHSPKASLADPIRAGHGRGGTAGRIGFFIGRPRPGYRPRRRLYSGSVPSPSGAVGPMSDVTRILSAIEQGDPTAGERLLPLVYDELR